MKVVLVGAPGAGKTALAEKLAAELEGYGIIDNYIEKITKRSDIAMSHFATYIGNMMCAVGRLEFERKIARDWPNLIVCGSLVETSVYQAINAYTHATTTQDPAFREASDKRAQVTMVWLSMLRADAWDYDLALYLPLSDEFKVDEENRWSTVVDEQIVAAAEALAIDLITLPTDPDDRLAVALEKIKEKEADEATEVDARPVGVGANGGSEDGNSDSDVSDVRDDS